jgi:hypothetical protein
MRTLNRPMFRYGGPIKEGVMNGIREPKRNGGSMANNEGPRRAALVGNPIYPKGPDGRTGHFVPTLIGLGVRGAGGVIAKRAAAKAAARGAGTMGTGGVRGQVPAIFNNMSANMSAKAGSTAANAAKPGFFKSLFLDDPLVKAGIYGYKALTGAGAKSFGQKAVRFAMSPSSIIAGTAYYMWPDGKERTEPPPEGLGGKKPGENSDMYQEKQPLSAEEIKAAENKARMEKMDSYRKIMDIKGMNKDAAYKSLIDASKIIQEGGNLKEQLKDGSLITKVTAAASKNFDKVRATENALSSLLVKSKIESDLRADQGGPLMQQAKDLVAAGGAANIKEAMEYLSKKPSIIQNATDYAKKFGKGFVDQDTAILAIQETFKERATPVITEKLFEEYKKADGYTTAIDLFEKLKGKKNLGEGYYVIGGNGFVIDGQGNTKQVL